jgi:hypothetical protein
VLGELVQTTAGKWITHPPTRCPNGHPLGPNRVLVCHQACLGHTTWTCRTCDATVYGPSLREALLPTPVGVGRFVIRATQRARGWRAVQSELGDGIS